MDTYRRQQLPSGVTQHRQRDDPQGTAQQPLVGASLDPAPYPDTEPQGGKDGRQGEERQANDLDVERTGRRESQDLAGLAGDEAEIEGRDHQARRHLRIEREHHDQRGEDVDHPGE